MPTNTKLFRVRTLTLAAGMLAATTAMASMGSETSAAAQSAPPEKSGQSSGSGQAGPPTGAQAQEKKKRAEGEGEAKDEEKKRGSLGAGGTTRPHKNPEQRRTQPLPTFMKQFDTDGNGMIDADERKAGKTKIDAYYAKLTAAIDTNKNKAIDADEWHKSGFDLSRAKGSSQPNARVKAMQERMETRRKMRFDSDRDGVLNESETKAYKASIQMRYLSLLERIDLNGDGVIDDTERKAYAAKVKHSRRNTPATPKKTDSNADAKKQSGTAGPPSSKERGTGSAGP